MDFQLFFVVRTNNENNFNCNNGLIMPLVLGDTGGEQETKV